jgi:sialidase-1
MYSTSTDGGITWATAATLAAHTGGNTQPTAIGRGDCSLVYDTFSGTGNGRIWAFYDMSPVGIGISNSDNTITTGSTTTLHPVVRHSDDNGATWSAEVDLIASLKTTSMFGLATSSGGGYVDSSGVIYQPYFYNTSLGGTTYVGFVAYSTDHGVTWNRSATITSPTPNEHHVVQLSTGTFLDSSRPATAGSKIISTATTITGTWTSTSTTALPDPSCNGALIRVDPDNKWGRATWLLASGCASTASRVNLTVWLSKDNGATWGSALTVYAGGAAYSSMTRLSDGTFIIVWEDTDHSSVSAYRFNLTGM